MKVPAALNVWVNIWPGERHGPGLGQLGLESNWPTASEVTLCGALPVAFIYSFFVEHYVSGLTGSVKE